MVQSCLFNITADPCETNNLLFTYPDVVKSKKFEPEAKNLFHKSLLPAILVMEQTLGTYRASAVKPANVPIDPRGDPKFYDYTWTNWLDIVDPQSAEEVLREKEQAALPRFTERNIEKWLSSRFQNFNIF